MFDLDPIGVIKSPVTKMSQGNWGSVQSEIHLSPEFTPGLKGLEEFSHAMVIFYMDRASFVPAEHLHRRPRGQAGMPEIGVFAQRTKYRPNPIGVTSVELISVAGNIITVRGLDALNDTPVLDLKPYMPIFDKVEDAKLPDWSDQFKEGYF